MATYTLCPYVSLYVYYALFTRNLIEFRVIFHQVANSISPQVFIDGCFLKHIKLTRTERCKSKTLKYEQSLLIVDLYSRIPFLLWSCSLRSASGSFFGLGEVCGFARIGVEPGGVVLGRLGSGGPSSLWVGIGVLS